MTVERFLESSNQLPLGKVDLHPQLLRETQAQLNRDVHDLTLLARAELPPQEFYRQFLAKCADAMMATGAAIWEQSLVEGDWEKIASHQLPSALLRSTDQEESHPSLPHLAVLEQVAADPQPVAVPPASATLTGHGSMPFRASNSSPTLPRSGPPDNPTDQCLLLAPIAGKGSSSRLWLQIVQRPQGGPATQRGYLRFVVQMSELVADYHQTYRLRQLEQNEILINTTQQLMARLVYPQPKPSQLRDLVETLRGLVGAEQVFLLYRDHPDSQRWRIAASSGLDQVDGRSAGFARLTSLAKHCMHCVRQAEEAGLQSIERSFWFDALATSSHEHAPVVEFMKQFHADRVACLPLANATQSMSESCAIAFLHWTKQNIANCPKNDTEVWDRWNQFLRLGLGVIAPSWWRAHTHKVEVRGAWNRLPRGYKRLLVALCLVAVAFTPIPTYLHTSAILRPKTIQNFYSPNHAQVREVLVEYGQQVEPGQLLFRLEDQKLDQELDEAIHRYNYHARRMGELQAELTRPASSDAAGRDFLESELKTWAADVDFHAERIERLRERKEKLLVRAPFRSVVGTWDVERHLLGRSFEAGELLLTLYQPDGQWLAEAEIDERSIATLMRSSSSTGSESQGRLVIAQCRLASQPFRSFAASLEQVHTYQIEPKSKRLQEGEFIDGGHSTTKKQGMRFGTPTYMARFTIEPDHLPQKAFGSIVHLRIAQPRTPLIWALTRDLALNCWTKLRMWL